MNADLAILIPDPEEEFYGCYPLKVCLGGGFASKDNLKQAKAAPKGPRKNNFHILGARIWVRFVRSEGVKPEE